MKQIIALVVLLLLIAGGGFWGYFHSKAKKRAEIQAQIEAAQSRIAELSAESIKAKAELTTATPELKVNRKALEELEDKHKTASAELNEARENLRKLTSQASVPIESRRTTGSSQGNFSDIDRRISANNKAAANMDIETQRLHCQYSCQGKWESAYVNQLSQWRCRKHSLLFRDKKRLEYVDYKYRLADLEKKKTVILREIRSLEESRADAQKQLEQARQSQEDQLQKAEAERRQARQNLADRKAKIETAERELRELKNQVQEAAQKCRQIEIDINRLKLSIEHNDSEVKKQEQLIAEYRVKL